GVARTAVPPGRRAPLPTAAPGFRGAVQRHNSLVAGPPGCPLSAPPPSLPPARQPPDRAFLGSRTECPARAAAGFATEGCRDRAAPAIGANAAAPCLCRPAFVR